jgi:hypothetical protein
MKFPPFLFVSALALLAGCTSLTQQTTPDVNYFSISGDAAGSLWVNNVQVRTGPLPVYDVGNLTIALAPADAAKYNDILKFSRVVNVTLGDVVVQTGGAQIEDGLDMNFECNNITFRSLHVDGGHQTAITVKGGCTDINFGPTLVTHAGGDCEVELGNVSNQSNKLTDRLHWTELNRWDGQAVRLRVMNATAPKIDSGNVTTSW